ncbi:Bax inhibitor-1 family protein [Flavobacterium sp. MAH-1]|uniref:Bax inhibitor-1 family protein n=1 Tax=Flavobacterium agri TaxID=2743471 RepID=A0A7Y9C5T7_9FLAO|nr:Bax inhibitor-1 family protein [Flavobacterium agri]NUY81316.1 Bax inhibitor-1 family protein [Flavobacterium agri]NYA71340.1 Bax inhibitor-1 family protein [Flavobacterium agri]
MEENILVSQASELERATFYKKTYTHVALAILAFMAVESVLLAVVPIDVIAWMISGKFIWLFLIGAFWLGSTISEKLSMDQSREKQYLGLAFYVLLEAIIFLPMIAIASMMAGGGEIIMQAAVITLFMFSGLTAVVFFTKADFSFLRSVLIIGGFVALGAIVAGVLFGLNLGLWFSVGMVVLACASILYQTDKIRHDYGTQQYVGAALQIFASVMLLFWYILRILMSRKS